MLNEKFCPSYTTNKVLSPKLKWNKSKLRLRFEESCLNQEDTTPITPTNVLNLFIVYELDTWSQDLNADFALKDCLFGSVKITKNADTDKYSYSGYRSGFDSQLLFSIPILTGVKMLLFWGLLWTYLCILVINEKTS